MSEGARRAVVIEDDGDIRSMLGAALAQDGFEVHEAVSGRDGLELVRHVRPDLVTLDISLPDFDGIAVCREVRGFSDAYIVMVTARSDEVDRLVGLEVGADDYLTKPFSPRELRARVAALFRRPRLGDAPRVEAPAVHRFGELEIDLGAHEVRVGGVDLPLTRTEFGLLEALAENPNRVLTRDNLYERVWGDGYLGDPHVVDVHMANLRRKLGARGDDGTWIRTVRGVGYRFGSGD